MTVFWILAGLMGVIAALFLLRPLWRGDRTDLGEREASIAVLRDQLRELERDREAGRIGNEEARAAKVEIERRALAADRLGSGARVQPGWRAGLVAGAAILTPVATLLLYFELGTPKLVQRSAAVMQADSQGASTGDVPGDMAERTQTMASRLEAEGGEL